MPTHFVDDRIQLLEANPVVLLDFEHGDEHFIDGLAILLADQVQLLEERLQVNFVVMVVEDLLQLLLENHLDQHHSQGKDVRLLGVVFGDGLPLRQGHHQLR